jgi:prophage regulatory protein
MRTAHNEPENYIEWPALRPLIGNQGRTTWWRQIKAGTAPAPVPVSPGRVAWKSSDIARWQAERASKMEAA